MNGPTISRRARVGMALASILLLGCVHVPLPWSPDGRWLAFTTVVHPVAEVVVPGWLFATASLPETDPRGNPPVATAYRIWATRPDTGVSVLLEEARGPLTSPGWSPDGRALAFGRVVAEEQGRARFEVVVQDAPERKRVILKQPYSEAGPRAVDLPALNLAWSPDGRYLAVPLFHQTLGMAIIRADTGRILKVVEDAYLASWSPDGNKLAFLRGGDAQSLHVLDTNFGAPRHLADIGQASQTPIWSRDNLSVALVTRGQAPQTRMGAPAAAARTQRIGLMRVPIDGGRVVEVPLHADLGEHGNAYLGASFSFDPEGENLFYTIAVAGQPAQITWFRPRTRETYKKMDPVDYSIRIGSLAAAPNGKALALRAGNPAAFPPPGILDLGGSRFAPVVPDDSARLEWIATLVAGARQVLGTALPPAVGDGGRTIERATVLPVPGELPANHESLSRLRRLGRIGRPLCDRPQNAPPAGPELLAVLDEARLFFDYLREDYPAALASLEALEARTTSPAERLRLLSVRAQVFLGQGQDERAKETIAYLQSIDQKGIRRIEDTPAGAAVIEEPGSQQGWPRFLTVCAEKLKKAAEEGSTERLGRQAPEPAGPLGGVMPFAPPNFAEFPRDLGPPQDGAPRMPQRLVPIPPRFQRPLPPPPRRFAPPPRPAFSPRPGQ